MLQSLIVGVRVPQDWQQLFQEIAASSGRKEASVVREARAQYLGKTDPDSVKGALAALDDRLTMLERKSGLEGDLTFKKSLRNL
jgi:RHH-type rel operon transcriptional repressor/antitoxin RelB